MKKASLILTLAIVVVATISGAYFLFNEDSDVNKILIDVKDEVGGTASGDGKYYIGDQVTLSVSTNYGFNFSGWYENGILLSTNNQYSFEVIGPKTISMKFDRLSFTINTTSNYSGGTITGNGTYIYESKALLTANVNPGYSFVGWYTDGKIISSNTTTYYEVIGNKTLEARYSIIHDASFTLRESSSKAPMMLTLSSTYNVEVQSRTWVVKDVLTNRAIFTIPGINNSQGSVSCSISEGRALQITQSITYKDGYEAFSVQETVIDQTVSKHYSWSYQQKAWHSILTSWIWNNKSATWDVSLSFEKYYEYSMAPRDYSRTLSNVQKYATVNDPTIKSLATSLKNFTSVMDDLERANCVLKFVQSLPYVYDINNKGVDEYWNYPYETLWDQRGDCDDHAILYATLMKAMGYRTAIIILPGHMAVGLDVPGASGTYFLSGGVRYYYCEPTAIVGGSWLNQYNVGEGASGASGMLFVL